MKRIICLVLALLLAAAPVCAAEYPWDDIPADGMQVQLPDVSASAPDLYEAPLVDAELENTDGLVELLQKQIDVTSGLNVWLGIIAGLVFIKILFDRIRVV